MSGAFVMFHLIFETELLSEPGTLHLLSTGWLRVSDPLVSRYLGYRWTSTLMCWLQSNSSLCLHSKHFTYWAFSPHPSVDSLNLLCCYSLNLDLTMTIWLLKKDKGEFLGGHGSVNPASHPSSGLQYSILVVDSLTSCFTVMSQFQNKNNL